MIAHWWVGLFRFWESLNRFPMGYFIPFYDSLFSLSDSNQIMTAAKKRNKINDFRNKNSFLIELREEWFYSKLQILARDERIWNFWFKIFEKFHSIITMKSYSCHLRSTTELIRSIFNHDVIWTISYGLYHMLIF